MIDLYNGDCLEVMDKLIEDGVIVDAIITDPPYGTMDTDGGRKININEWDKAINPKLIFERAEKLLRKNGRLILFSQEPYTSSLVTSTIPNIKFNQRAIWLKDTFGLCLGAKKHLLSLFEDIVLFSKKESTDINPIKEYTNKIRAFLGKTNNELYDLFETNGKRKFALLDTFNSNNARRYNFMTLDTYNFLISKFNIHEMQDFIPYEEALQIYKDYENKRKLVYNLDGLKYKSNVLNFSKDKNNHHPTQKPVELMEYLIKTYTNQNEIVLDFTMGSGSTGVACVNTNRRFIGVEMDENYFNIAKERIGD